MPIFAIQPNRWINISFNCSCGSKGNLELKEAGIDIQEQPEKGQELILKNNRYCCLFDESPLFSVVAKQIDLLSTRFPIWSVKGYTKELLIANKTESDRKINECMEKLIMDYPTIEKKLLSFNGSYKEFPFGDDAAVFKVLGKMFALVAWQDNPLRITLKCDPGEADMLRSQFDAIKPGYYMNKNHWNTITLDDSIPEDLLFDMIDSSYDLVVKGLSKANRESLSKN